MSDHELLPSSAVDPSKTLDDAQAALGRLSSDLEHTERLATLGVLAASIAHEMSNILTPVLAYAQMAASHPDDRELQAKAIEKAVHCVESATRIADAVLGFAGRSEEDEADVEHAVHAALDCLARDPNKDRIKINIDVQPGTLVRMNPLSLQQVLLNLMLNAQTAMRHRGGRLTIAALTRADGTIGIRVSDTGPGIPREIAGRIFEPFVTSRCAAGESKKGAVPGAGNGASKSSRSQIALAASGGEAASGKGESSGRGTGLGLAICRRLIEQAGGTITATSKPGDGATFIITLPSPMTHKSQRPRRKAG